MSDVSSDEYFTFVFHERPLVCLFCSCCFEFTLVKISPRMPDIPVLDDWALKKKGGGGGGLFTC